MEAVEYDYIEGPVHRPVLLALLSGEPCRPNVTLDPGPLFPFGTRKAIISYPEETGMKLVKISWNPKDNIYLVGSSSSLNAEEYNREKLALFLLGISDQVMDDLRGYFALDEGGHESVLDEITRITRSSSPESENPKCELRRLQTLSIDRNAQKICSLIETYTQMGNEAMMEFFSVANCGEVALDLLRKGIADYIYAFFNAHQIQIQNNASGRSSISKIVSFRDVLVQLYEDEVEGSADVNHENYTFEDFLNYSKDETLVKSVRFFNEEETVLEIVFEDIDQVEHRQLIPAALVDGLKVEDLKLRRPGTDFDDKILSCVFNNMLRKPATPEHLDYQFDMESLSISVTVHYSNSNEDEFVPPVKLDYDLLSDTRSIFIDGERYHISYPYLEVEEIMRYWDPKDCRKLTDYLFMSEESFQGMAKILAETAVEIASQTVPEIIAETAHKTIAETDTSDARPDQPRLKLPTVPSTPSTKGLALISSGFRTAAAALFLMFSRADHYGMPKEHATVIPPHNSGRSNDAEVQHSGTLIE